MQDSRHGFRLHAPRLDEVSLKRFVDRFLGRTSAKAPFDDAFPNAEGLIAKTKEILAGPDLEAAGRTLGELAILYVSAETPHATRLLAVALGRRPHGRADRGVQGGGSAAASRDDRAGGWPTRLLSLKRLDRESFQTDLPEEKLE